MASCAEHKLHVTDENQQRTKLLQRAQWLRAAMLGANDGLLSTTSLMLGVGAAKEDRQSMVLSGLAGAIAGACSMAVGELVSVSTQRDIQKATVGHSTSKTKTPGHHEIKLDITTGPTSIKESMQGELNLATSDVLTTSRNTLCRKLTFEPTEKMSPAMILEPKLPQLFSPGRSPVMKVTVEDAKTNKMKLRSPVMEVVTEDAKTNTINLQEDQEEEALPNPYKAAAASALAFLCGSFVPLASAIFVTQNIIRIVLIAVVTSIALVMFGGYGAYLGGSPVRVSAVRVLLGGWIAMAITYGLLKPFDKHTGSNDKA